MVRYYLLIVEVSFYEKISTKTKVFLLGTMDLAETDGSFVFFSNGGWLLFQPPLII